MDCRRLQRLWDNGLYPTLVDEQWKCAGAAEQLLYATIILGSLFGCCCCLFHCAPFDDSERGGGRERPAIRRNSRIPAMQAVQMSSMRKQLKMQQKTRNCQQKTKLLFDGL